MRYLLDVQDDIEVVGVVENGEEAIEFVQKSPPDVVLMDLNMPIMDGIEATNRITALNVPTQIVILTSHHQDAMVFPAIKAGALSYLLKNSAPDEVIGAIRAAANNSATLHPRVAKRLMDEVTGKRISADSLTNRELEVLKLIATGNDNKAIAQALTLSEKTVKTHVSNLLGKLHLTDRTQAAIYAIRQGIVPLDDT